MERQVLLRSSKDSSEVNLQNDNNKTTDYSFSSEENVPPIEQFDDNELSSSLLNCLNGNSPEEKYNDYNECSNVTKTTSTSLSSSSLSSSSSYTSFKEETNVQSQQENQKNLLTTNRLSTNPFVILNNVRKRAATAEFEKIASKVFHDHISKTDELSNGSSDNTADEFRILTDSSLDRERNNFHSQHNDEYMLTSKYRMSEESPGETNF